MFHIRDEGQQVRSGFNFYRLSDTHNAGFVFALGSRRLWFRFGKVSKHWIIG